MRTNDVISIEETSTKKFFADRASKYSAENPYAVTLYQDDNPELVSKRNAAEIEKLMPVIDLSEDSFILDIGCGIGRWADAIKKTVRKISGYEGIDFSEELIKIASERNGDPRYHFQTGGVTDVGRIFRDKKFNRIMMMGVSIYLNDEVLLDGLNQISAVCENESRIVFREPVGIEKRLSLKDFYSDELKTEYSAIYRTKEELMAFYKDTLIKDGFALADSGPMYEDKLNNRKETTQWFFSFIR